MQFEGRSGLLEAIDAMTVVSTQAQSTETRPVLVLEGCGGSGRTALLNQALDRWKDTTPAVLVRPRELVEDADRAVRPVLAAVMLGLSPGAPGYALKFERVLLAHIAIKANLDPVDPDAAKAELRTQTNLYRQRELLEGFVGNLVHTVGAVAAGIQVPGMETFAPAFADQVAKTVVGSIRKAGWRSRLDWTAEALDWFGHQDQDMPHNSEMVRVTLNRQARSNDPEIRREVDDLLVAALLADLRHSVAAATGHRANVLVLLDNGDASLATSFTDAVLRVRQAIANTRTNNHHRPHDPLTLITTSNGRLTEQLNGSFPAPASRGGALWRRQPVDNLPESDVIQMAKKSQLWPEAVAASSVGRAVYRLTRGHAESTAFVLEALSAEPKLVDDLDDLLRRTGPEQGQRVERHLLQAFVRGLSADQRVDEDVLETLITLSAARNRRDALALADMLPPPIDADSAVLTSPTLWSGGDAATPTLHPPVRYLGLRSLAARADGNPAGWNAVFERLRDNASGDDVAASLHYSRLLGERAAVATQLAALLPEIPTADWLDLTDEIASTPDPRERNFDVIRASGIERSRHGHIVRLLGVIPALHEDPCITRTQMATLCDHARHSYNAIANDAQDTALILARARRYPVDGGSQWR